MGTSLNHLTLQDRTSMNLPWFPVAICQRSPKRRFWGMAAIGRRGPQLGFEPVARDVENLGLGMVVVAMHRFFLFGNPDKKAFGQNPPGKPKRNTLDHTHANLNWKLFGK